MAQIFRFWPGRRPFEHSLKLSPPVSQEEVVTLFAAGDYGRLLDGHTWLVTDLAARQLDKFSLPAHLGEELACEGLKAIARVLSQMKRLPDNLAAYLSRCAEVAMFEYAACDSLCYVPERTRRDRKAKGKAEHKAPNVYHAGQPFGKDTELRELMDTLFDQAQKYEHNRTSILDLRTPADLYPFCADKLDCALIELRHGDYGYGHGPRAMEEVAGELGVKMYTLEKRLDAIESRVYLAMCGENRRADVFQVRGKIDGKNQHNFRGWRPTLPLLLIAHFSCPVRNRALCPATVSAHRGGASFLNTSTRK